MMCHVAFQVERTVEMRSCGGRDLPQRRLVMVVSRLGFVVGGGDWRDILGPTCHDMGLM